jgi:type VI secretion system protein ImpG
MDDLLPYYERELGIFRQYTRQFAARYPKTAGKLLIAGESSEDPHVERLIQSFALLTARVSRRLENDYSKFTESMLESLYPHYLRPLPSYSIVQIGGRDREVPDTVSILARGSMLHSVPVQGVTCQFRTAYDVTLAPVAVSKVEFAPVFNDASQAMRMPLGVTSSVTIVIESTGDGFDFGSGVLNNLRVFVDGDSSLRAALIDTLFMRTVGAYVQQGLSTAWDALKRVPLNLVGLDDDEAMLPFPSRSNPAFRLLTEYFSYPEKFNFIDIDLTEVAPMLPEKCRRFTLQFALAGLRSDANEARILASLSSKNLLLGCAPVINLFEKRGVPVQLTHTSPDYPLLVDPTNAAGYEINAVNSVRLVRESELGNSITEFSPLYSVRHGDRVTEGRGNYWLIRRDEATATVSPGHEVRIALIDAMFSPSSRDTSTILTELTCSNRDLPSQLRYGHARGDLTSEAVPTSMPVRLLRKPTPPYRFGTSKRDHQRLISHLTLNYSALTQAGLADFKEMLRLYDLPDSATSQRQISGIVGLDHGTVRAWMPTVPVSSLMPGIGIRMALDEAAFVGSGIYVFARIMDRYLALNRQLNCFTQLEIVSGTTGKEILKCPPRCAAEA